MSSNAILFQFNLPCSFANNCCSIITITFFLTIHSLGCPLVQKFNFRLNISFNIFLQISTLKLLLEKTIIIPWLFHYLKYKYVAVNMINISWVIPLNSLPEYRFSCLKSDIGLRELTSK